MVLAPEYSDNKKKKEEKNDIETVMNSIEFPVLDQTTQNSVISTTSNDLSNWSRLSSLWPLLCTHSKFHSDQMIRRCQYISW